MTVGEFKKFFSTLPDDMKVYLSSDEEGNRYGETTDKFGSEIYKEDNVLILFPSGRVEFDEIAPITYSKKEE